MKEFISSPDIPRMTEQHSDQRRTISEVQLREDDETRRVTLLEIGENGGILGNHYHLDHDENFRLFSGEATVYTANYDSPEDITSQHLIAPAEIIMPRGVAHTFVFEGPAQLVSTMEGEFDPNDMNPTTLVESQH